MTTRLGIAVALLAAGVAAAPPAAPQADSKGAGRAQLERLKKLAGDWSGRAGDGKEQFDAKVTYRVTAQGSTVVETFFAGTPHEMVTMYHLDGDALVLTHYCAAGNQPRMRARPGADPSRIVFDFRDGTNLDASRDMHMHAAALEILADDHIRSEWTSYQGGKPAGSANFDLRRASTAGK